MGIEASTVEIEVTFRHTEGDPTLNDYVLKRLGGVIHSLPNLRSAAVEITLENTRPAEQRHVVQVTLAAKGNLLRVEDHGDSARAAIDGVHDLLQRRIRDWKGQAYFRKRREMAAHKQAAQLNDARSLPEDRSGLIVRLKSHETKPMFPEDAAEQMELLGHDFFFFLNAETGQHNVVYRRKAGGYGLIEPAIAGLATSDRTGNPSERREQS